MTVNQLPGEAGADLLERRWFAAYKAASMARADCEILLEAMESTQAAWLRGRERLIELETLQYALGEQLAALDALQNEQAEHTDWPYMVSASRRSLSMA